MITKKPYVISKIEKQTPDVTIFSFKATDGTRLPFEPGMFVMVYYRNSQTNEEIGRAFSLASLPDQDTLEFAIAMIHGRFTSKLDTARVGDTYYVTGPYGQFKLDPNDKKLLFIAGGTGLAPFLSMLKYFDEKKMSVDAVLLYSVRYAVDIIDKNELERWKSGIGLRYYVTVTRPEQSPEWNGEKGHIDANMIAKYAADVLERTCYIVGPLAFTKAMKEALKSLNVQDARVKADVWG